jgi:hypothetical protein
MLNQRKGSLTSCPRMPNDPTRQTIASPLPLATAQRGEELSWRGNYPGGIAIIELSVKRAIGLEQPRLSTGKLTSLPPMSPPPSVCSNPGPHMHCLSDLLRHSG